MAEVATCHPSAPRRKQRTLSCLPWQLPSSKSITLITTSRIAFPSLMLMTAKFISTFIPRLKQIQRPKPLARKILSDRPAKGGSDISSNIKKYEF